LQYLIENDMFSEQKGFQRDGANVLMQQRRILTI
jgi:hypothetical protein